MEDSYAESKPLASIKIIGQRIVHFLKTKRWLYLGLGFLASTPIVYAASFFINDKIDWRILLFLNPDSPVPVLDDLMILVTDFSMGGFGIAFLFWEIGYQASKNNQKGKENAEKFLKISGMGLCLLLGSAFFWAGYDHRTIFFPLALLSFAAFWFMGNTMTRYGREDLDRINHVFWLTLLAALLTELSAEVIIKDLVERPRPLSDAYIGYNQGIRVIADEVVRGGHSYVAGHSAVFFAMIIPLMVFASKRTVKIGLFAWATLHAFSRVYLAAHFPFCSFMGAVLGLCMGTLVVKIFRTPIGTPQKIYERREP